jgi:hypothetical protein
MGLREKDSARQGIGLERPSGPIYKREAPQRAKCTAVVGDYPTAPEALARVRVVLSRSVIT